MIQEILYSYLLPAELGSLSVKIIDYITKVNLEILSTSKMVEMISGDINELNNALTRELTNEYTQIVKQKDDARNIAFAVLRDMVKANLKRKNKVIADAAKLIMDTIKKHGSNLNKQSGTEKSYTLSLLVEEFKDDIYINAFKTLGLTDCFEELKQACAEHKDAYNSKLEIEGKKEGLLLKDARENLSRHLRNLLGTIDNLDDAYPGQYKKLVSMINETISDLMWQVKSRKTRDKNNDADLEKNNSNIS